MGPKYRYFVGRTRSKRCPTRHQSSCRSLRRPASLGWRGGGFVIPPIFVGDLESLLVVAFEPRAGAVRAKRLMSVGLFGRRPRSVCWSTVIPARATWLVHGDDADAYDDGLCWSWLTMAHDDKGSPLGTPFSLPSFLPYHPPGKFYTIHPSTHPPIHPSKTLSHRS